MSISRCHPTHLILAAAHRYARVRHRLTHSLHICEAGANDSHRPETSQTIKRPLTAPLPAPTTARHWPREDQRGATDIPTSHHGRRPNSGNIMNFYLSFLHYLRIPQPAPKRQAKAGDRDVIANYSPWYMYAPAPDL